MFSASTILTCYLAPKDQYSYDYFRKWHKKTKRRWKCADINGADEIKVLENNRRHHIKYNRQLAIHGWVYSRYVKKKTKKIKFSETFYQDVIGDPYYDYSHKFNSYVLDWWGVGGNDAYGIKAKRNIQSVPNTPMLDVSINLDRNSVMEKVYMKGMSYEEAISTTFKGRQKSVELINELTRFNMSTGMDDIKAYQEALRMVEIFSRNIALTKNPLTNNEYNFIINYYNKFINKKIREMMKFQINFWFLKELLTYHPNISVYVLGPYNMLYKIHGLVSKRDQNVIIKLSSLKNTNFFKYQFVYSVARSTLVNDHKQGYIPAAELKRDKNYILNMMYGSKEIYVEHRYRSETFYDLILDGYLVHGMMPWIDAYHNCWLSPNYSNTKNLSGLDIIC